jgi:hypothetical protein
MRNSGIMAEGELGGLPRPEARDRSRHSSGAARAHHRADGLRYSARDHPNAAAWHVPMGVLIFGVSVFMASFLARGVGSDGPTMNEQAERRRM